MRNIRSYFIAAVSVLVISSGTFALADGTAELQRLIGGMGMNDSVSTPSLIQNQKNDEDNILRLTPDRTKVIRLDEDAASVIVANPAHATVLLDSPRLLLVMPRQPGATTFTVLNAKGDEILQKDVLVTATEPKYVRIRRMCNSNDASCASNSYFYCPNGCYEVQAVQPDAAGGDIPAIAGGSSGTAGSQQGPLMPVSGNNPADAPQQAPEPEESTEPEGDAQ